MAAYEVLLAVVARQRPGLPVLFVNTCAQTTCARVHGHIVLLARARGLPVVSYFDLVLALVDSGRALRAEWWAEEEVTHPPWPVHQLIADAVMGCLEMGAAAAVARGSSSSSSSSSIGSAGTQALPPALSLPAALAALETCDAPRTFYSAFFPPTAGVNATDWPLWEDRRGKPGWISTAATSRIAFDLHFGAAPRLFLSYLRSYEGLGTAVMYFDSAADRRLPLPGVYGEGEAQREARVSDSFFLSINVCASEFQPSLGLSGVLGWAVPPHSAQRLTFEVAPPPPGADENASSVKFKILTVASC